MSDKRPKIAILDMNNNVPNQGLRCIKEIVEQFDDEASWKIYDVRHKNEFPDLTHDIYISSGGPGSPHEQGEWRKPYFKLMDEARRKGKHVFFICYSFQLACYHFGLSKVTKRRRTSFGVYPIHKTKAGREDVLLEGLSDPYYAVDSRDWQVVQPDMTRFRKLKARILSLEKIRTNVEYERAIMAVRFSSTMVGTQFHPEADPYGMKNHLLTEENKIKIIKNFNLQKYEETLAQLEDPEKIKLTHETLLPQFIRNSLTSLKTRKEELNLI
ncbi:type 1 glutamine amidotransferase [Portibacter marinus]|uniref:type 1 glutamine amidotransferase n=1 Tax=Portibacter marinus TaxID=2898660 RepID=UPI001F42226D|nr:homoserine O-succinyltransferase [Portibacter marinus]